MGRRAAPGLLLAGFLLALTMPVLGQAAGPQTSGSPATGLPSGSGAGFQSANPVRFGEIFLYGLITLEPGGGTVRFPDGRPPVARPMTAVAAPVGASIVTASGETATLRFGCGSVLTLGPDSRVLIRSWNLDLQQGTCRVRHLGSDFPMKVGGVATLTLSRDTALEVALEDAAVAASVQAGRIAVEGYSEPVVAGEKVIAAGSKVRRTAFAPAIPDEVPGDFWLLLEDPRDQAPTPPAAAPPVEPAVVGSTGRLPPKHSPGSVPAPAPGGEGQPGESVVEPEPAQVMPAPPVESSGGGSDGFPGANQPGAGAAVPSDGFPRMDRNPDGPPAPGE